MEKKVIKKSKMLSYIFQYVSDTGIQDEMKAYVLKVASIITRHEKAIVRRKKQEEGVAESEFMDLPHTLHDKEPYVLQGTDSDLRASVVDSRTGVTLLVDVPANAALTVELLNEAYLDGYFEGLYFGEKEEVSV